MYWTGLLITLMELACISHSIPSQLSLRNSINKFSLDLLRILEKDSGRKFNILYSPVSIASGLSMIMLGTKHNSLNQLIKTFHYDQGFDTLTDIHRSFKELLTRIDEGNQAYTLKMANRVIVQSNYTISDNYKWYIADCYKTKIQNRNFGKDAELIKREVNNWVDDQTVGMIKNLIDEPIDPFTRLILLNVVYFEGKWMTMFNKKLTRPGIFYNHGTITNEKVQFMRVRGHFRVGIGKTGDGQEFSLLELPYNGNISMFIVLTKSKTGIYSLIPSLRLSDLSDVEALMENEDAFVNLPKIVIETDYDLRAIMPKMGVEKIFGSQADLSGICNDKNLEVSSATHKAKLIIDEDGTRAAAATNVRAMSRSLKFTPEFEIDHPFLFYIRDIKTGLIQFIGKIDSL